MMQIEINNCNNINHGTINVEEGRINIFYGINGTGKSTISKAIHLKVNSLDLGTLKSFYSDENPDVIFTNTIGNVLIFNEDYINNFIYKQDELVSGSFDIFIRTDQYKNNERRIDELLIGIKNMFEDNEYLNEMIQDFVILKDCFKWNADGGLSRQSEFHKAYGKGNLIENIPERLSGYAPFIHSQECTQWVDRQTKGNQLWDESNICPYCASNIIEKKDEIKLVSETYNKNDIDKLVKIKNVINELGEYFSDIAKERLMHITNQANGLTSEQNNFIRNVYNDICTLYGKLNDLKNISFDSFSRCENVDEKLREFRIDLDLIDTFMSEYTQQIIDGFNLKIDEIIQQIGYLIGLINIQRLELRDLVKKYKIGINSFLKKAGYNYEVDIPSDQNYKLRLKPRGVEKCLNGGKQYLSFGEKNAFALILFMYEALSKNPDLIVLDDPISSFDESKKYAIIHTLFTGSTENSLRGKNVVMFTHDIEPIIDMKKVKTGIFNNDSVYSSFIKNKDGVLEVIGIEKEDILSFYQIREKIKDSEENDIVKLVYLRKLYNGLNDNGNEYQVLSNLLHGRTKENCIDYRVSSISPLSEENFIDGVNNITEKRESFDFDSLLGILSNSEEMLRIYNTTSSNLTKIILFRRIYDIFRNESEDVQDIANDNEDVEIDDIVDKFIKEEYHIENSYLFGLDPTKFDIIPDFIIKKCDKFINSLNN